ncbi:arylformamidase [Aquibacillus koreensis]|uniref:Kynurenine formamidase n=1 Tax=Aquibacillus koreensis TaxID=279446 RepID=A0A9X4AHI3_9BACI|nr:arylformamidase [Aquibacillus koreensis]MCT2535719.1 arylformamidase [Aquibacillus koreensis]MDC3419996.1 arylformamidase [Aquibacillus koreensis]
MTNWIDISQPLTNEIAHWPEDTPFSYQLTYTKQQTGSVNIGQILTSVHTGTHVDAPFHFDDQGEKILDLDVSIYIGRAKVIDVSSVNVINRDVLNGFHLNGVERLLLRTSLSSSPNQFPKSIPILDPDVAPYLAAIGIRLLGVNMPSVDPLDSKELPTHHALHQNGIYILENVILDAIKEGDYFLSALPLALEESDGSPVRAVIRKIEEEK